MPLIDHIKLLNNKQSTNKLIRRLVRDYAWNYVNILLIGFGCLILLSASSVVPAKLLEKVVNEIFIAKKTEMLVPVTSLIFLAFLVKGLGNYGASVSLTYVGQRIISDIQRDLFNHLMKADLAFFHNVASGELISRFNNDVNRLQNAVTTTLSSLIKDVLTLAFFIGLMIYQDWLLTILSLIIIPPVILPITKIGKRIRKFAAQIQGHNADLTILLGQAFQGMRIVKAYCLEQYKQSQINRTIEMIFTRTFKATRIRSAIHPIMELLSGIAIGAIVWYGGQQVIHGNQTPGAFFSFIAALMMAYEPLKRLASLNTNLQEQLGAAGRVFAILDYCPSINNVTATTQPATIRGDIVFDKVNFFYRSDQAIIKNISLAIKSGQRIAIVGNSGAGKSSFINLIPRFYEINSGNITIDGIDIKQLDLMFLRQSIALVSQEITLFNDSIKANIAYGKLTACAQQIEHAARLAAADEFITDLTDGYDTIVGENGINLSGGQRQRIAVARAFLKNAPILLLDEPTAALDSESERKIQQSLANLTQGRTTIIIAHRLATVIDAEQIFVMNHGQIIDCGTHQSLLQRCVKYQELVNAQLYVS